MGNLTNIRQYDLEGKDYWKTWNVGVGKGGGIDDLMRMPKMKTPNSYDWKDEDGVEYDLADPKFYGREITQNCFILIENDTPAANTRLFWKSYNDFTLTWAAPGLKKLYCAHLDTTYDVFYRDCTEFNRVSPLVGTNKIYVRFTITFCEPKPTWFNHQKAITFNGRILTFNGKNLII